MNSTVIIGFGHLGNFTQDCWPTHLRIHALTRTKPKVILNNLTWHEINFNQSNSLGLGPELLTLLKSAPWINFWLPPSTSDGTKNIYLDVLKNVISLLRQDQLFTFISSTSIFGSQSRDIFEDTEPDPETKNAKILVEAEEYIRSHHHRHHIIRPSGLVDYLRHPVFHMAGKANLSEANKLVNLIHSSDVVRFIWHLYHHFKHKNISTNISCYTHLSKEVFYTNSAKTRRIALPEFLPQDSLPDTKRKIQSQHLWQKYQFQLKYLHVD